MFGWGIRDDLVVVRGGHDELAGRLVGGMIDAHQPVAKARGEVVTEEGPLPVLVVADDEAIRRSSAIAHVKAVLFPGRQLLFEQDHDAILAARIGQPFPGKGHASHSHADLLGIPTSDQVQSEALDPFSEEYEFHLRLPNDLVSLVAQLQMKSIVDDIDIRIAWIAVRPLGEEQAA
jgi:hypothetical protein